MLLFPVKESPTLEGGYSAGGFAPDITARRSQSREAGGRAVRGKQCVSPSELKNPSG